MYQNGDIIGVGITESTYFDNINTLLNLVPDNTTNSISPRDIRDSIFSLWERNILGLNGSGTEKYISTNPDIYSKMLLGKYNYSNGNTETLLGLSNSDTDIYFYNTKLNTNSNTDTKISFLAGNNPALFTTAPYFLISSQSSRLNFNIRNLNGDISLDSMNRYIELFNNNIGFRLIGGALIPVNGGALGSSTSPINSGFISGTIGIVNQVAFGANISFSATGTGTFSRVECDEFVGVGASEGEVLIVGNDGVARFNDIAAAVRVNNGTVGTLSYYSSVDKLSSVPNFVFNTNTSTITYSGKILGNGAIGTESYVLESINLPSPNVTLTSTKDFIGNYFENVYNNYSKDFINVFTTTIKYKNVSSQDVMILNQDNVTLNNVAFIDDVASVFIRNTSTKNLFIENINTTSNIGKDIFVRPSSGTQSNGNVFIHTPSRNTISGFGKIAIGLGFGTTVNPISKSGLLLSEQETVLFGYSPQTTDFKGSFRIESYSSLYGSDININPYNGSNVFTNPNNSSTSFLYGKVGFFNGTLNIIKKQLSDSSDNNNKVTFFMRDTDINNRINGAITNVDSEGEIEFLVKNVLISSGCTLNVSNIAPIPTTSTPIPLNAFTINTTSVSSPIIKNTNPQFNDITPIGIDGSGKLTKISTNLSDTRLKENIFKFNESVLKKLEDIDVYRYNLIGGNNSEIGFLAQEIEKLFPEFVYESHNGFKAVDYAKITTVLLKAIQELNVKIKRLESNEKI